MARRGMADRYYEGGGSWDDECPACESATREFPECPTCDPANDPRP